MNNEIKHKMFSDPACVLRESELSYLMDAVERAVENVTELSDQIHRVALKSVDAWPNFDAIRGLQHEMSFIIEWQKLMKVRLQTKTIDREEEESLR